MAMLDSVAVFHSRAKEIGLLDSEYEVLKEKNWHTFGNLAFSCNYQPNSGSNDEEFVKFAATVTGAGLGSPPEKRMPALSRLFFEAFTLAAADMRSRVERRGDEQPRSLALPERVVRNKEQKERLKGVRLNGEREVSHALVDLIVAMAENNELEYVKWSSCTKRDQELMGVKAESHWKPDPTTGYVKECKVAPDLSADTSTDLLLRNSLQRRDLAFDNCRLVNYEAFSSWTDLLLDVYTAEPISNHARISIGQLHRADLALFKVMIRLTPEGIRPSGDGKFPLEEALMRAVDLPEVRLHLQPVQGSSSRKLSDQDSDLIKTEKRGKAQSTEGIDPEAKRLKATVVNLQNQVNNLQSFKGGTKGGSKGGSKGNSKSNKSNKRLPKELIGMEASTSEGEPICYDFNLGGCSLAKGGERCSKRWHVCCVPKCFSSSHGKRACPKAGGSS